MFCKNCGTKLDNDASFCPQCGQKLNAQVTTNEIKVPQKNIEQENVVVHEKTVEKKKTSKKVILSCVVAVLLIAIGTGAFLYFSRNDKRNFQKAFVGKNNKEIISMYNSANDKKRAVYAEMLINYYDDLYLKAKDYVIEDNQTWSDCRLKMGTAGAQFDFLDSFTDNSELTNSVIEAYKRFNDMLESKYSYCCALEGLAENDVDKITEFENVLPEDVMYDKAQTKINAYNELKYGYMQSALKEACATNIRTFKANFSLFYMAGGTDGNSLTEAQAKAFSGKGGSKTTSADPIYNNERFKSLFGGGKVPVCPNCGLTYKLEVLSGGSFLITCVGKDCPNSSND